jgi:hypothetical protein
MAAFGRERIAAEAIDLRPVCPGQGLSSNRRAARPSPIHLVEELSRRPRPPVA